MTAAWKKRSRPEGRLESRCASGLRERVRFIVFNVSNLDEAFQDFHSDFLAYLLQTSAFLKITRCAGISCGRHLTAFYRATPDTASTGETSTPLALLAGHLSLLLLPPSHPILPLVSC